jgi:hypothetical protein
MRQYRLTPLLLALSVLLFNSGCISHISMRKVQPGTNPRGQRVHLPAPFIVGYPNAKGKIDYKVELLPDPEQEYAIDAWTLMATQRADVERTIAMYVQKVTLKQNTADVAERLAQAVGEVGKSAMQGLVEKSTAENTAAGARQSTINEKELALKKAELELAAAVKVRDATIAGTKEREAAEKVVQEKTLAVQIARAALDAANGTLNAREQSKTPEKKKETISLVDRKPGPIIYEIIEDENRGGIKLKPVHFTLFSYNGMEVDRRGVSQVRTAPSTGRQLRFETITPPKPPSTSPTPPPAPAEIRPARMLQPGAAVQLSRFNGIYTVNVQFDQPMEKILKRETGIKKGDEISPAPLKAALDPSNPQDVLLTFDKDPAVLPNGDHNVVLSVMGKNKTLSEVGFTLLLRP